MGNEGKLAGRSEPTEYLCRYAEDRAQFRGMGLPFSKVKTM